MIPVSFYTLGCKLNQNETEALSDSFCREGFTVIPWNISGDNETPKPLLCIINTCTVTCKAEQKARRIIRLCLHSGSLVLVTGCYAQLERKALEKLGREINPAEEGTLYIFPGQGKEKLLDLPRYLAENLKNSLDDHGQKTKALLCDAVKNFKSEYYSNKTENLPCSKGPFSFNPGHFSFHSRSFLKIQDGCDFSCAYCRVPLARGKSTSLGSKEALVRLKALEDAGMAEAVLTGVNICQYLDRESFSGAQNEPGIQHTQGTPLMLPGLLKFLLDNTKNIAIRLSSIEPNTFCITDCNSFGSEFFFRMLAHKRIRNHFHLSVQSGSDSVLAKMGRSYKVQDLILMVEKLRSLREDPFIACDIITGFPGETDDDFEKTAALCRDLDFAWIHAFPYSKRPGTAAASVTSGLVNEKTARERLHVLLELAKKGKGNYIRRWQGKIVDAVAESASIKDGGKDDFFPFFPALTDNYIKVRCVNHLSSLHGTLDNSSKKIEPGNAFRCRIGKPALENENGFDAWADFEN